MSTRDGTFEALARVLSYPGRDYAERVVECADSLHREHPEAASLVRRFATATDGMATERLQELFTQTFDLNPVCSLEVGWQLYGEEYTRGNFLVTMREQLRKHEIQESPELPDHLTHILPLLDRLEDGEAREFAATYVMPAIKKMLPGFEGKNNPYENVMQALNGLLEARQEPKLAEVSND